MTANTGSTRSATSIRSASSVFSIRVFGPISARELPQFKGGDAEYPLRPQRRDRACVHACSLEHRREPQVSRQRDRIAVNAWNVEEDLATAAAGQQSRQNHFGGGAVVGH